MSTTTQHQLKGPKPLPVIGNVHQFKVNEIHQFIEDCRLKYGANFKMKIGPKNLTVITDETDIKFILKNRPTIFRRAPKLDEVLQEANIQGVFNAEGEEWKKQRKIVAQGLDQKHLDRFYAIYSE